MSDTLMVAIWNTAAKTTGTIHATMKQEDHSVYYQKEDVSVSTCKDDQNVNKKRKTVNNLMNTTERFSRHQWKIPKISLGNDAFAIR